MFYHRLGSRLRLTLGLMDVFFRFGFSWHTTWIWPGTSPLGLISDGSDGAPHLLWLLLKTILRLCSKKRQCCYCCMAFFYLLQYQHQVAYFLFHIFGFAEIQILRDSIHHFQRSFGWGFQWMMSYKFIRSVILWIYCWGCCWGWWKFYSSMAFRDMLLGTVGLAGLGADLMVLFFFCDFFWGLGTLKWLLCGDIGLVVLYCLGSHD